MKHTFAIARNALVLLLLMSAADLPLIAQTNSPAPLTNQDVLQLVELGFSDTIILTKIHASTANFDTSIPALKKLKDSKVSEVVIKAMLEAGSAPPRPAAPATPVLPATPAVADRPSPSDPLAPHDSGIYALQQGQLILIQPSTANAKTGGGLATAATLGIRKTKGKSFLKGVTSRTQLADNFPVFYFYFPKSDSTLGGDNFAATAPTQYELVQFDVNKEGREVEIMAVNAFGSTNDASQKKSIAFTSTLVAPNIYKVMLNVPLAPGEYCFLYPAVPTRLYDFGFSGQN